MTLHPAGNKHCVHVGLPEDCGCTREAFSFCSTQQLCARRLLCRQQALSSRRLSTLSRTARYWRQDNSHAGLPALAITSGRRFRKRPAVFFQGRFSNTADYGAKGKLKEKLKRAAGEHFSYYLREPPRSSTYRILPPRASRKLNLSHTTSASLPGGLNDKNHKS